MAVEDDVDTLAHDAAVMEVVRLNPRTLTSHSGRRVWVRGGRRAEDLDDEFLDQQGLGHENGNVRMTSGGYGLDLFICPFFFPTLEQWERASRVSVGYEGKQA